MEYLFLLTLFVLMAFALGSGYPVAFALPGSAIITIAIQKIGLSFWVRSLWYGIASDSMKILDAKRSN